MSTMELFVSPISIGGKWGGDLSIGNVKRVVMGKMETKINTPQLAVNEALIRRYVDEVSIPTDPDIQKLNADPNPDPDYTKKLAELKSAKRDGYLAAYRRMYNLPDPAEAAKPQDKPAAAPQQQQQPVPVIATFSTNVASNNNAQPANLPPGSRVSAIIASTRVEVKDAKKDDKKRN